MYRSMDYKYQTAENVSFDLKMEKNLDKTYIYSDVNAMLQFLCECAHWLPEVAKPISKAFHRNKMCLRFFKLGRAFCINKEGSGKNHWPSRGVVATFETWSLFRKVLCLGDTFPLLFLLFWVSGDLHLARKWPLSQPNSPLLCASSLPSLRTTSSPIQAALWPPDCSSACGTGDLSLMITEAGVFIDANCKRALSEYRF